MSIMIESPTAVTGPGTVGRPAPTAGVVVVGVRSGVAVVGGAGTADVGAPVVDAPVVEAPVVDEGRCGPEPAATVGE
jgi:hypothetical protein